MTNRAGLPDYDQPQKFPPRVWSAVEQTREHGFPLACIPEVGRLLRLLAGARGVSRIAELGTAYGVGAAWIESGMREGASLLTVELDPHRARSARALFAADPAVEVVHGDWTLALEREPFDMVFSDGGPKRNPGDPEKLLPLLVCGGILLLDDYTPGYGDDVARRIWFESPLYRAVEITVTPAAAVILATRL